MDDEQSINDILDADDDHENWSDFSIEEELPSNYREEERNKYNNNKSTLCQETENSSTAAQKEALETEMETQNLVKIILQEILERVFESSQTGSGSSSESEVQDEIRIAQDTCLCQPDEEEAFEVKNDSNNNVVILDFAHALASEVISEMLNEAKDLQEMEDEDELFLVLHPPTHESGIKSFSFVPLSSRIFYLLLRLIIFHRF